MMLFIAVAVIPLLFLAFSVLIDVRAMQNEQVFLQQLADGAVTLAAKDLPLRERAKATAKRFLAQYSINEENGLKSIVIDNGQVAVHLERKSKNILSSWFGLKDGIGYSAYAMSQIVPQDVAILIDASSYMSPEIFTSAGLVGTSEDGWGTDLDAPTSKLPAHNWPAAKFANSNAGAMYELNSVKDSWTKKVNAKKINGRLVTQQCFSPPMSSIKQAAIRLYDYYSSFPLNQVAVMVGPSGVQNANIGMIRAMAPGADFSKSFSDNPRFSFYRDYYASDEYCFAIAERETAFSAWNSHQGFMFPPWNNSLGVAPPIKSFPLVNSDPSKSNLWRFSDSGYAYLTTRDVIWSLAARRNYQHNDNSDRHFDFGTGLERIVDEMIGAPNRPERQGLNHKVVRTGFVLMGDLPRQSVGGGNYIEMKMTTNSDPYANAKNVWVESIRPALHKLVAQAKKENFLASLFIVFFNHPGNYMGPKCNPALLPAGYLGQHFNWTDKMWQYHDYEGPIVCLNYYQDVQYLDALVRKFLDNQDYKGVNVTVIRSPDHSSLAQDLVALLPLTGKSTILSH